MADLAPSPLSVAAAAGDEAAVERLLAAGASPDGATGEIDTPLYHACRSAAPSPVRLAIATRLLDAGAAVRRACNNRATALHAAAWRGPVTLVELLIRRGALSWQTDADGKSAVDHARAGADRDRIVELLDRPVIRDPSFREAVRTIHQGDADALAKLLDAHPRLLRERAVEPDCHPQDYFRDPKLFWFVANNPILTDRLPANIVEIAQTMIARGVDRADLDVALELLMSGDPRGQETLRRALLAALLEAGARASPRAILVALGHGETAPVETLLERGHAMTAPIAAALGRVDALAGLLARASPAERHEAFGLAVINRRVDAARLCLDAGADPNAFLPLHAHSAPLHHATINEDLPMMELLLARGARTDIRDTLWNGTPLGWALHSGKAKAEALLRGRA